MLFMDLIEVLSKSGNEAQAEKMSKYMKNRFPFWGIPKPELAKIMKPYISATRKNPIDWEAVFYLWDIEYREAQYVALEYLKAHKKQLQSSDFENIKRLIITKSWWETVDELDACIGLLVQQDETLAEIVLTWSLSDNIWLRRVSIDYQLQFKEKTNTAFLSEAICNNFGSTEFFVNKAIGWSLREYSKTDAQWVRDFLAKYEDKLVKLSIKEAGKYL